MISYRNFPAAGGRAHISLSEFRPVAGGDAEYNAIILPEPSVGFAGQWEAVAAALAELSAGAQPVFLRIFLSDPVNQAPMLPALPPCAVSTVGQAPMSGGMPKVALWAYLRENARVERLPGDLFKVSLAGGLCEYWQGGVVRPGAASREAAAGMLADYAALLRRHGASLADDCMRTWFFVRDVDTAYAGMVRGRNDVFSAEGLLPSTHFIASTGIGAYPADTSVSVMLDTYAVVGSGRHSVTYLKAASHLNPTSEYGVAFERATAIDFADRRHVLVSGTASIDNRGEIVHPGDICRQTARMCENVDALLAEGGCAPADITHAIVYIRDTADAGTVASIISARYPAMPFVVVLGPVCRPGWLVEMECMAVR